MRAAILPLQVNKCLTPYSDKFKLKTPEILGFLVCVILSLDIVITDGII